ncbi:hypothetical protein EGR_00012 [Echinococcus granulosus]|uniref:Uncharacterized protein n=1 Tax=Echinococcus granulosus TaxID=6210 RepID=W6UTX2_ECHGR|nr:hypothetical protein EGR_00012 [Echinococcus granulosus]EUB64743.1 hypothetical protein EGR_00012 [Echinococcus granulosus]
MSRGYEKYEATYSKLAHLVFDGTVVQSKERRWTPIGKTCVLGTSKICLPRIVRKLIAKRYRSNDLGLMSFKSLLKESKFRYFPKSENSSALLLYSVEIEKVAHSSKLRTKTSSPNNDLLKSKHHVFPWKTSCFSLFFLWNHTILFLAKAHLLIGRKIEIPSDKREVYPIPLYGVYPYTFNFVFNLIDLEQSRAMQWQTSIYLYTLQLWGHAEVLFIPPNYIDYCF